jgi:hypothetical protein
MNLTVDLDEPFAPPAEITIDDGAGYGVVDPFPHLCTVSRAMVAVFALVVHVVQQKQRVPQNPLFFLHSQVLSR